MGYLAPGLRRCFVLSFLNALLGLCGGSEAQKGELFAWAYGWVVDSITVSGNSKTRDFVVVREMETRPGSSLDRETFGRDRRYLVDLGLFAKVEYGADSLRPGHCAVRINVKERSTLFLKSLLPVINYDFDKGFSYGLKWDDRNFRGRMENLSASYMRSADKNDHASIGWFAPWIGWHHVTLSSRLWYFHRSTVPESFSVLEQSGGSAYLALPLTRSRISFSQAIASLSIDGTRSGKRGSKGKNQLFISPVVGVRLDSRDSRLRPRSGHFFYLAFMISRAVSGEEQTYYRLWNELRFFYPLSGASVLALQSDLEYQFGSYPEYSTLKLGGSSTLRGYQASRYSGYHRWYETLEWRYSLLDRKIFRLPYLGYIDIGISFVTYLDGGIVWRSEGDFSARRFHGGGGFGLRLYSPFQDVVRLDLGFNAQGEVYPYVNTGIRF